MTSHLSEAGPTTARRQLGLLVIVCVPLAALGVQTIRVSTTSGVQAADASLSLLLCALLPLACTILLTSFNPEPHGLLVHLGESRRRIVITQLARLSLGAALLFVVLCGLSLVWTRGVGDPLLVDDLLATSPIAFGATFAIFTLCAAARAWGGRYGLWGALVLLWTVGRADIAASAALPSGHIQSLLGVGSTLNIAPSISAATMATMALLFLALFILRVPP